MTTLHVDGARTLHDDDADQALQVGKPAGVQADALAAAYQIRGGSFTVKADGVTLAPDEYVPAYQNAELVEHVDDETPTDVLVDPTPTDEDDED